jgi:hypothetical protein
MMPKSDIAEWTRLSIAENRMKTNMAKSNQKSNRVIRKPKSAKPKPAAQASPFEKPQGLGLAKKGGGKQAR